MRVLIFQHAPFEGMGAIGAWAGARGYVVQTVMAVTGEFPPTTAYDLLVVLGGPMGANDDAGHAWLVAEKSAIRDAIDAGKRVFGVCLGAQLVASVLGAPVGRNPVLEIGWYPVTLTPEGRASHVFGELPAEFIAGHWHGDTFDIPEGAVRTASSQACPNQAFEYDDGRVLGVQFHLEWDTDGAEALVESCSSELTPGPTVAPAEAFLAGEHKHGAESRTLLSTLLDGILA
ncbi:MAG: amidotransferase [Actinobacteria bacterium HGW-Actinobacteria-6]|nr:MAG: amidotransferase [Actinobacteria bacterium HGW-Actinobacteria-6]